MTRFIIHIEAIIEGDSIDEARAIAHNLMKDKRVDDYGLDAESYEN